MSGAARALQWRCQRVRPSGLKRLGKLVNHRHDRDRGLELFPVNEEFLVSASHKLALITSLPFVHTARRYYRLNGLVPPKGVYLAGAEKTTKLDHLEEVKVWIGEQSLAAGGMLNLSLSYPLRWGA
ncbi:hypothetical protein ACTXT7_017417 [Hymenolepis weldensis]